MMNDLPKQTAAKVQKAERLRGYQINEFKKLPD